MSFRQPIRTLLLAVIVIAAALAVRHYFEDPAPAPHARDDTTLAPVRVARDVQPTIVEPDENWLDTSTQAVEPANLAESHSSAPPVESGTEASDGTTGIR